MGMQSFLHAEFNTFGRKNIFQVREGRYSEDLYSVLQGILLGK